jgi:NAD(P)-dependent dehydrogenase (short-subunit alcohol dehydrogenase family)
VNNFLEAFNLSKKVIVVAGGNGLIGSAITEALSEMNSVVVVLDKDFKNIQKLNNVHFIASNDNFSQDNIKEVVDSIESEYGPISGLINCMTNKVMNSELYFSEISDYLLSIWREVIQGNLENSFLLCREIGLRMTKRSSGSIVNFCSIYGAELGPDLRIYDDLVSTNEFITTPIPYSVSKGGLQALTKHLATSWGRYGVRVNCISPGGVFNSQNKKFVEAYSNRIPLERMANVEEIIGLPIFLMSDMSSYITGQNIFIDGGLSAW